MAKFLACTALSHYVNQCWLIVNWTLRNKFQSNSNRNTKLFIMKMLSATWQPFCPGRDELIRTCHNKTRKINFGVMMKITGILYVVAFSNMTQHTYIYIYTVKPLTYVAPKQKAQSIEAMWEAAENEDVIGAVPTSEWSTMLLPTKVRLILEVWQCILELWWNSQA